MYTNINIKLSIMTLLKKPNKLLLKINKFSLHTVGRNTAMNSNICFGIICLNLYTYNLRFVGYYNT